MLSFNVDKANEITIDLDKMKEGWFGQSQRSYLWEIVDHNDKVYEIQVHDLTESALKNRELFGHKSQMAGVAKLKHNGSKEVY